ncbi:hypothetical protein GF354_04190 [Candidatus Peregrinibacteria bacterium]|nr:hypothetical protein [Candidatus Peregrinibacteria bacterium]
MKIAYLPIWLTSTTWNNCYNHCNELDLYRNDCLSNPDNTEFQYNVDCDCMDECGFIPTPTHTFTPSNTPTATGTPTMTYTLTITPIPHPSFYGCMENCVAATYPTGDYPKVTDCIDEELLAGGLLGCAVICAPTRPAWPGCVGSCVGAGFAGCLGIGVVESVAVMTGCAWGCW